MQVNLKHLEKVQKRLSIRSGCLHKCRVERLDSVTTIMRSTSGLLARQVLRQASSLKATSAAETHTS